MRRERISKVMEVHFIISVYLCIAIISVVSVANAEILLRDTFEDTPTWTPWIENTSGGGGLIGREAESNDDYQTQAHGDLSYHIVDLNSNSLANARHSVSIPDTTDEYMIEFYFWVPTNHVEFDSFPLMVPWHIGVSQTTTDISVFLDQDGDTLKIQVQDADSLYPAVAIIDTARWYKFQIHRIDNPFNPTVDFYLDGDLKGQFNPLSPTKLIEGI